MRSELIGEIFSVEAEAERLVSEAQKQARSILLESQEAGQRSLQAATEQSRAQREARLASAQEASAANIRAVKERIEVQESEDDEIVACAHHIAEQMVELLIKTDLGDRNP